MKNAGKGFANELQSDCDCGIDEMLIHCPNQLELDK
jgi:hypothetical protein